jgi:rod shape-determining protein MreD
MKPRVYVILLLLIIPFQESVLDLVSVGGVKPDLALTALFVIGLLTGPAEAALAGMGIGLVQDIGSAGLFGFCGLTRGLAGLAAGLLGARVRDITSPVVALFLAAFSVAEGILIYLFLHVTHGEAPFFSMTVHRLLPQALYTGMLGFLVLRLVGKKNVLMALTRRSL